MIFLAIAGLWALVFGRITISGSLSLEGRPARYYGVALLVIAPIYGLLGGVAAAVMAGVAPALAANEVLGMIVKFAVLIAIIVGLVPVFRPKPAGTIVSVTKY
jgi:hypothetical protein